MRLEGRRESSNVEDRRGLSGGAKAGLGIGGIALIAIITMLSGGDLGDIINIVNSNGGLVTEQTTGGTEFSAQEQELATFSSKILAGTEDVWSALFRQQGLTYTPPKMVLYTNSVQTACGGATSAVGPFYCSGDQTLYIDLSFFSSMKKELGADGDFAYAYVIAHEVGHHVEYLLGTLQKVNRAMQGVSKTEANRLSVRLELLADYYAGVWANNDNRLFSSIEEGDIKEAIRCSEVIGDDYLQEKSYGRSMPDTFTHGTSEQRERWLALGLKYGDMTKYSPFNYSDEQL